jgi:hypothetical protein
MIERSLRYSEYVRRRRSYDGSGVPVSLYIYVLCPVLLSLADLPLVSRIVAESKRLDSEE